MHLRRCSFHCADFHEAQNKQSLGTYPVLNCSEIERKRRKWGTFSLKILSEVLKFTELIFTKLKIIQWH